MSGKEQLIPYEHGRPYALFLECGCLWGHADGDGTPFELSIVELKCKDCGGPDTPGQVNSLGTVYRSEAHLDVLCQSIMRCHEARKAEGKVSFVNVVLDAKRSRQLLEGVEVDL